MAGEENLKPIRSVEEAREKGKKGGIASGEARRKKKELKECLDALLERELETEDGDVITGAEAISIKLFKRALKGDLRAFELVRDTAGQKPVEKVAVSEIPIEVTDEIEAILDEYEQGTDSQTT